MREEQDMRRPSLNGGRVRFVVVLAAGAVAAAALVSSARAAPIRGATFASGTWFSPPSFLFFTTVGGDPADGLAPLGCPFIPEQAPTEAQTSRLTYAYNGWIGPTQDPDTNPNEQFLLRTHVAGTVEDAAGNTYHLSGDFLDSSTHFLFDPDLFFDGFGKVTIAGSNGVVVGNVELRLVNGPADYAFVFSSIKQCTVIGAS
jgi:hypothetical protein